MAARNSSSGRKRTSSSSGRRTSSKRKTSGRKGTRRKADFNENGLQDEIVILVFIAFSIILFLSNMKIMGSIGEFISGIQFGLFGMLAYLFPILLAAFIVALYFFIGNPNGPFKMFISFILFLDLCSMSHMFVLDEQLASKDNAFVFCRDNLNGGGVIGAFFAKHISDFIGKAGSWIVLVLLMLVCIMILTGVSLFSALDAAGSMLDESAQKARDRSNDRYEKNLRRREENLERRDKQNRRRAELDSRRASIEEKEDKQLRREKRQEGFDLSNSSIPKKSSDTDELMYLDEETGEVYYDEDDNSTSGVNAVPNPIEETLAGAFSLKNLWGKKKSDERISEEEMKEGFEAEMENRAAKAREIPVEDYDDADSYGQNRYDNDNDGYGDGDGDGDYEDGYYDDGYGDGDGFVENEMEPEPEPTLTVDDLSSEEYDFSTVLSRMESPRGGRDSVTDIPRPVSSVVSASAAVPATPVKEPVAVETEYEEVYEEDFDNVYYDESDESENQFDEAQVEEIPFVELAPFEEVKEEPVSIFKSDSAPADNRGASAGAQFTKPVARKEEKLPELPFILKKGWRLPRREEYPSLFNFPDNKGNGDTMSEINEMKEKIKDVLDSFGVSIEPDIEATKGPAVTRFEIAPVRGVKVSKILNLEHDIMLGLAAESLRIEAPIPGVSRVGLEIPNRTKDSVAFCELLTSREYRDFSGKLAFAVGRGMSGENVIHDIAKMPHVLVAGATGSGKSVCINTIIISLLMKYTPQQLRLYMVDPKVVELSVYNDIPHLYGQNVVTDPKQATAMLQSVVMEMDDRYVKFATAKVRDIKGYNEKALENAGAKSINDYYSKVRKGQISEHDLSKPMPHIVVIIDELADLMMTAGKEVEASIVRIAQLARACGIHLVIATQRPSVDVVTGLIKANMPSRIAFAVSSGTDSRTIIDAYGAEKLLGMGDMLFYPAGKNHPERVQGAYVSDEEVQNVIDFWVNQMNENEKGELNELQKIDKESGSVAGLKDSSGQGGAGTSDSGDEYLIDAARFIIQSNKASIGMLQRKFKIGFNRAARIMDSLHDAGVVGDEEGTKSRKILMDISQLENLIEAGEI